MTSKPVTLVWFRQDLRLDDNLALRAATQARGAVMPVFVWAPDEENSWPPGAASRWWLHQSLRALDESLRKRGSRLILKRGPTLRALQELIRETNATKLTWNRRYEPAARERDEAVRRVLSERGIEAKDHPGTLLFEPSDIETKSQKPFQVFTPFWKVCLASNEPAKPQSAPRSLVPPTKWPKSVPIGSLELEPKINWAEGIKQAWTPGEAGARKQLRQFLKQTVAGYETTRDEPAIEGTSRLSPHLHFGEISPLRIWHEIRQWQGNRGASGNRDWKTGPESYLRQLGWREFAYHLLWHFTNTTNEPLRKQFARFPWRRSNNQLKAWQQGQTGYPFVDAGMRELWATGWMHNRVRMIVGSFLVKDLRLHWLEGARWFWDTLVDADLANNTLGWQWIASCGADAAPYFRIFNPVTQGEKFDPGGDYVRRWVPEIARLPNKWIHKPWQAPSAELSKAGITMGKTYPKPIVDHADARNEALAAFQRVRKR